MVFITETRPYIAMSLTEVCIFFLKQTSRFYHRTLNQLKIIV